MLPLRERTLLVTAALGCAAVAVWIARSAGPGAPPPCVTARREVTVRGGSLGALAPPGTVLELWEGAYGCTLPQRGHWVALSLEGRDVPLAKVVHAVPQDRFEVEAAPGGLFLRLNGARALNSRGEPFQLDARAWRLLRHLAELTGGEVPQASYLVFGDTAAVTVDSRAFGLVAHGDLAGRLLPRDPDLR